MHPKPIRDIFLDTKGAVAPAWNMHLHEIFFTSVFCHQKHLSVPLISTLCYSMFKNKFKFAKIMESKSHSAYSHNIKLEQNNKLFVVGLEYRCTPYCFFTCCPFKEYSMLFKTNHLGMIWAPSTDISDDSCAAHPNVRNKSLCFS